MCLGRAVVSISAPVWSFIRSNVAADRGVVSNLRWQVSPRASLKVTARLSAPLAQLREGKDVWGGFVTLPGQARTGNVRVRRDLVDVW